MLLSVVILGLSLGLFLRTIIARTPKVQLEPRLIEVPIDVLQHETVPIYLMLTNQGDSPFTITKVDSSCGCMSIVTRGGLPFVDPIVVSPGDSMPWEIKIAPYGRNGKQTFKVLFETMSQKGAITQNISTIVMNIRPAIATDPPIVELQEGEPGTWQTTEVKILDGFPGIGLLLDEIRVSDSERIKVELSKNNSNEAVTLLDYDPNTNTSRDIPFISRYLLKIRYLVPSSTTKTTLHDQLTLVPQNEMHPEVIIPVYCKIKPTGYELSPQELWVFPRSLGQTIKRTLSFRFPESIQSQLQVLKIPPFVSLDIVDVSAKTKRCIVTIDIPEDIEKLKANNELVFAVAVSEDRKAPVSIPIRVLEAN